MNIWNWILSGIVWILQQTILPLFGTPADQTAALSFAGAIGTGTGTVFELVYVSFGSVFNLTWFFIWLTLALVVKGGQMLVSVWMFLKGVVVSS